MKNNQVVQDKEELLKLLPALMHKVITAQAQLAAIEDHLETAQGGVLRSSLPPVGGEPQFTPQFVEHASDFLGSLREIDGVITAVAESIEQIESATSHLVVGVGVQLQVQMQQNDDAEVSLTH